MIEISKKSNLLEQKSYRYQLQDIDEPNLYREIYTYTEIPKVPFNHRRVPLGMPPEIWTTAVAARRSSRRVYTVPRASSLLSLSVRFISLSLYSSIFISFPINAAVIYIGSPALRLRSR